MNNYHRLLIHKTIEEDFHTLCSFSIGVEEERRTVVCSHATLYRFVVYVLYVSIFIFTLFYSSVFQSSKVVSKVHTILFSCRAITMSNTNDRAEEVLNKGRAGTASQHWGHSSLDDEVLGAHWDSSSTRTKGQSKKEYVSFL